MDAFLFDFFQCKVLNKYMLNLKNQLSHNVKLTFKEHQFKELSFLRKAAVALMKLLQSQYVHRHFYNTLS